MLKNILAVPDFLQDADDRYPGLSEEYCSLARLAGPMFAVKESDAFRHTLLSQCGIAWHHYNAVVLLLAHKFVVPSLVLSRTLFEVVVGTLHLLENPNLLPDFLDHGKLVFYESAIAANLSEIELAPIKQECEKIKPRFLRGKTILPWHRSGIKKLSHDVGLAQAYEVFYPDASGAVHSDASKILSFGSGGWRQDLRAFVDERQAAPLRYGSFTGIGILLSRVNEVLNMGHDEEAKALLLLMQGRCGELVRSHKTA